MTLRRSREEVEVECGRLNAAEPFIEHRPWDDGKGGWSITSSLRPDWRRFSKSDRLDRPVRRGERFVAREDVDLRVVTYWDAPYTGGHSARLPRGTVVVASEDQIPDVPGFGCVPEDYEGLEPVLVPDGDRTAEKYGGYSLSFTLDDIGTTLLEPNPDERYGESTS